VPYQNVVAFQRVQGAIESTRGTEVTTMTRELNVLQQGGASWTYTADREDAPETLNSFAGDRDTTFTNIASTLSLEARLSYEEVPWWFSLALNGAAGSLTGTTTGSTPPGYTYSIDPVDTSDNLDTATIKIGDGAVCYAFRRFAINTMTLRFNPNSGGEASWRISVGGPAIFIGPDTFDSPAATSRTIVESNGTKLYLDTASAIGTTQLTGMVRNGSITVMNNIEEKRFAEGTAVAEADFGRGNWRVTGDFTVEHLSDTQFALMRANTDVKLRFLKEGAQIGTTPTTLYKFQLDIPEAKLDAPSRSYMGNNAVLTFPFLGEKPSAAAALQTDTVNALATVTA
jgi:hypothetical protein